MESINPGGSVGWRERYRAALDAAEARAAAEAGTSSPWRLAFGFTNSVDRIVSLDGGELARLIGREGAGAKDPLSDRARNPTEFLARVLRFVRSGTGGEIWVADQGLGDWLAGHFRGRSQVGGTGVRGANTLAGLGFSTILHVTSFPAEQAVHVDNSGRVVIPRAGGLTTPPDAVRAGDRLMEHFIFEFQAGTTVPLATETVVAPQANRIIVPRDPVNFRHPIDPHYVEAVADPAHPVRWVLVSGYNQVADAAMSAARIDETLAAIRRWRRKPSPPRIHLELGAMPDTTMLRTVLDRLAPRVESVGLNADELAAIHSLQGDEPPPDFENTVRALTDLHRRLGVARLSLHSQHYCLSLTRDDPATEQAALLYGSLVAGTFARRADFPAPADLRRTLTLDGPGPSGLAIAQSLAGDQGWTCGVSRWDDHWLVFVPTLAISHPATTIGLGDSFTAGVLALL